MLSGVTKRSRPVKSGYKDKPFVKKPKVEKKKKKEEEEEFS